MARKARPKNSGSIWKKSGKFILTVRSDGKSKSVTLRNDDGSPCRTRQEAERAANKAQGALTIQSHEQLAAFAAESRRLKAAVVPLAVKDLWQAYLAAPGRPDSGQSTLKLYKRRVGQFVQWCASQTPPIAEIGKVTDGDAAQFLIDVAGESAAQTYNSTLATMRMIFQYVLPMCGLDSSSNPFSGVRRRRGDGVRREVLSIEQLQVIFRCLDTGLFPAPEPGQEGGVLEWRPPHLQELRVLFHLLVFSGCRLGDGSLAEWKNIDFSRNEIQFRPRKTRRTSGKTVVLPIHPDLKKALLEALEWRASNQPGEDYVLPLVADRYHRNAPGVSKDVSRVIRMALGEETSVMPTDSRRKIAANRLGAHALRHSFVSLAAESGVPLAVIGSVVGHTSSLMTTRYVHGSREAQQRLIDAIPTLGTADGESAEKRALCERLAVLAAGASVGKLQVAVSVLEK